MLNAANEVAVDAFLAAGPAFLDIADVVERRLDAWAATGPAAPNDLDDVLAADAWARATHATTSRQRRAASPARRGPVSGSEEKR